MAYDLNNDSWDAMANTVGQVNASSLMIPTAAQAPAPNSNIQTLLPRLEMPQPQPTQESGANGGMDYLGLIASQYLKDRQGTQTPSFIKDLLADRLQMPSFSPSLKDIGDSVLHNSLSDQSSPPVGAQQFANERAKTELAPYTTRLEMIKLASDAQNKLQGGGDTPASVREYQYYNTLNPQEQQNYLNVKRNQQYLNLGDRIIAPSTGESFNKGAPPQMMPGFRRDVKSAEAVGKIMGETTVELPQIIDRANYALALIEQLKKHPGKNIAVGYGSVLPIVPGTDQADFVTRLEQIQGQNFLQAFSDLKGGGAISEVEGLKATNAVARMNRRQKADDFDKSLDDLEGVVRSGIKNAKQKAGVFDEGQPPIPDISASNTGIPRFSSPTDPAFSQLPPGSQFIDGEGNVRIKR